MPLTTAGKSVPQVVQDSAGNALANASVSAPSGYSATINGDGELTVTGPPSDGVTVTITPSGGSGVQKTVPVLPDVDELGAVKDTATAALPAASATLDSLTDVTITSPAEGQVLKRVGSAWVNSTDSTGGGGSALTVQDEGSALSTAADTLNFVGAGVTATGTGTTKTITIPGAGAPAGQTLVVKPTAESLTSNATLQNDDHLTFTADASSNYLVEVLLYVTGPDAGDFQVAVTYPSGATARLSVFGMLTTETALPVAQRFFTTLTSSGTAQTVGLTGGGTIPVPVLVSGTILNGATAGPVTVQWAQAVSNATATSVLAGSRLLAVKA